MIELESHRTEEFPAPAERVWALIGDFGAIGSWWPEGMLSDVIIEGEGVGMVRHLHTGAALVLSERLDAIDVDQRTLELSLVGELPLGIVRYSASGRVRGQGAGHSTLEGRGRYRVASPEQEEGARAFLEGAYETMFAGLRAALG